MLSHLKNVDFRWFYWCNKFFCLLPKSLRLWLSWMKLLGTFNVIKQFLKMLNTITVLQCPHHLLIILKVFIDLRFFFDQHLFASCNAIVSSVWYRWLQNSKDLKSPDPLILKLEWKHTYIQPGFVIDAYKWEQSITAKFNLSVFAYLTSVQHWLTSHLFILIYLDGYVHCSDRCWCAMAEIISPGSLQQWPYFLFGWHRITNRYQVHLAKLYNCIKWKSWSWIP